MNRRFVEVKDWIRDNNTWIFDRTGTGDLKINRPWCVLASIYGELNTTDIIESGSKAFTNVLGQYPTIKEWRADGYDGVALVDTYIIQTKEYEQTYTG